MCRRTIERWYVNYKDNKEKSPLSAQGFHIIIKDLNPFKNFNNELGSKMHNNQDICIEIKNELCYT